MDLRRSVIACAAAALLLAAISALAGCCDTPATTTRDPNRVGPVLYPPPPDLTTPVMAVRSYNERITLAYRLANSLAATSVITGNEDVRVDAYIHLGVQRGEGIEQSLERFDVGRVRIVEPTATVSTRELWRYRYFALKTLLYKGPEYTASYDATYTLVREPDRGWVVDSVVTTSPAPVR